MHFILFNFSFISLSKYRIYQQLEAITTVARDMLSWNNHNCNMDNIYIYIILQRRHSRSLGFKVLKNNCRYKSKFADYFCLGRPCFESWLVTFLTICNVSIYMYQNQRNKQKFQHQSSSILTSFLAIFIFISIKLSCCCLLFVHWKKHSISCWGIFSSINFHVYIFIYQKFNHSHPPKWCRVLNFSEFFILFGHSALLYGITTKMFFFFLTRKENINEFKECSLGEHAIHLYL